MKDQLKRLRKRELRLMLRWNPEQFQPGTTSDPMGYAKRKRLFR